MRGYVRGQYLARHTTAVEFDGRMPFSKVWGGGLYAGLACLYNDPSAWNDGENGYLSLAAGVSYVLKPEKQMVVRLDFAVGKGANYGICLNFGNPI